jgi:hypothetical protein
MKALKELFDYEYVGGGYFREKGVKKGDTAKILHGMQAVEHLHELMTKRVDKSD